MDHHVYCTEIHSLQPVNSNARITKTVAVMLEKHLV